MPLSDAYPVLTVDPEWKLDSEVMGTKAKFWYQESPDDSRWLFKFPRKYTGEHWSEKIAAEIAALLNVSHGRVELAELDGERGSTTETFARNRRELRHGNELLAKTVSGYDRGQRFGQSQHTLGNVLQTLERIFVRATAASRASRDFAGYLVLDAVIGNTDRHHENWGILVRRVGQSYLGYLAPSFDHASSLGRELSDERRLHLLKEDRVGDYSERGRGGIYLSDTDKRAPSPLELVRRSVDDCPALFSPTLKRAAETSGKDIRRAVERIPGSWMSRTARDFAVALMGYNLDELRKLGR